MSRIKILDDATAGQIAAGEVVDRPVSVVKELVENSLDAGADRVVVEIRDGGRAGIKVIDNGCGMSQEELSLAFFRHATSKIARAEDLYSLSSLGFRGEALPSIAAVSHLVMKTRMYDQTVGYSIEICGGEVLSQKPVGCAPGTIVYLTDLFYNVPARRKHLKTKGTEAGLIAAMMQKISLARPDVGFTLIHNNKTVFRAPGSGRLYDSVLAVYGAAVAGEMLEINAKQEDVCLEGFVGKSFLNRRTRHHLTIIINGRYVRSKVLQQAVIEAYSGKITPGRYPIAILSLTLDPARLDVNIHPAKMEIRIDSEDEISTQVRDVIREKLRKTMLVPEYYPKNIKKRENLVAEEQIKLPFKVESAGNQTTRAKNGQKAQKTGSVTVPSQISPPVSSETKTRFERSNLEIQIKQPQQVDSRPLFPDLHVLGQLLPTYILTSGPDGLYIIDQHAAHERIIYEELLSSYKHEDKRSQTQLLLTAIPMELNYSMFAIFQENIDYFNRLGFMFEEFGQNTYLLRGVPARFATANGISWFMDLLEEIAFLNKRFPSDIKKSIVTPMACKAAIKSGEVLTKEIMNTIVQQLSLSFEPYTCPHGRPTLIKITERELAIMFRRIN